MKKYLRSVGIIFFLVMSGIGSLNFFVDPLLLFHYKNAGSEKLSRIEQFPNMRLYKPLHVNENKPEAIIIGTSRSGTIRARHPDWRGLRAYNFSMPGMTIYELSRSVQHAQANQPLRKLMIGLDYNTIISPDPLYRSGFEPDRMAQLPTDFYSVELTAQKLHDLQRLLFSYEMLSASTLALAETSPRIRKYHVDGSWEDLSNRLTGRGGYIYVARNNTLRTWKKTVLQPEENIAILKNLLDFCYSNNIETRLFFTPMHSFILDLWFRMSPVEMWRDTYKQIVQINTELAEQYDRSPFQIWGFANEAQAVSEPIYFARQIDQAWFNDGLHYRAKMAASIMEAMWGSSSGFGQQLTVSTVNDYLDTVDSLRETFVKSNESLVGELHEKIGEDFSNMQPLALPDAP